MNPGPLCREGSVARVVRTAIGVMGSRHVRALACLAAVGAAGCAARTPVRLSASSTGASVQVTGRFAGTVSLDGDVLTLQLDNAEAQYAGLRPGDRTTLEGVTVRAVVAADSAGRGIPLGVSGALAVADVLQAGERRDLGRAVMAVPLPPGARMRDLWLAFQFRGTARPDDQEPLLVIAYVCSEANLLGVTRGARARARRMRASYGTGCRL